MQVLSKVLVKRLGLTFVLEILLERYILCQKYVE